MIIRLSEVYGELQLLLNILSMRVAVFAVVPVGLLICEEEGMNALNQEVLKCHSVYGVLVD